MEKRSNGFYTAQLLISYVIFGSVGIFVRYIPLPSSVIAAFRGIVGGLLILLFMLATKRKIEKTEIVKNATPLFISGLAIGFNWIFLFEAYRYTSIAAATLCYYMAPIFVVIAAPIILKERLSPKNIVCVLTALAGMFLVSSEALTGPSLYGILFGLAAALLYATAIICNKMTHDIAPETRAMTQLFTAGITVLPYTLLTADIGGVGLSAAAVIMLVAVGVLHTGVAYVLNLGSLERVSAGTVAVLGYTDPIVAILLEAVIDMKLPSYTVMLGAVLILGATAANSFNRKN